MIWIAIFLVVLALYGCFKTLALVIALGLTFISCVLCMLVSGLVSYAIWPEVVQQWDFGEFWVSEFLRHDWNLIQLMAVPFIFLGDVLRVWFIIMLNYSNPVVKVCAVLCFAHYILIWGTFIRMMRNAWRSDRGLPQL